MLGTTVLTGDVAAAITLLKATPGGDSLVIGSGELVQTLTRNDLVDEYRLWWHPGVLGSGRRLFPEGSPHTTLQQIEITCTANGTVIGSYRPVR